MSTKINACECFQPGEVWQTPRGTLYRVMDYEHKEGKTRKQAVLRVGADGAGRKVLRDWDAVEGWIIHQHRAADCRVGPTVPREQLLAAGFKPVTYEGQVGEFLAKELSACEMPHFLEHVVDGETIFDTDRIVVEVCPDGTVQLVDQDADYYETCGLFDSDEGRALLKDVGFTLPD